MLSININVSEQWDPKNNEFISNTITLQLEHSLVSISKWESKWHTPFISAKEKTAEQTLDYIKCMTLNDVPDEVYSSLSSANMKEINDYVSNSMTATWFNDSKNTAKKNSEQVTSELIYYWMISLEIPFECQYWHLNRLMTLIRICSIKNQPSKKLSKKETLSKNAALNAARRKRLGSSG